MIGSARIALASRLQGGLSAGESPIAAEIRSPSLLERALGWGLAFLPAFVLVLVLAGVLVYLHRALDRGSPSNPTAGFRRQIVLLAVTALGALVVLLALPLSEAVLSGLLSLIGLVVSAAIALSATTFISNAMAGVMIRAVRNFKIGDFLQVGEHFGRVTERELFHTEIQTEDRDLLTLPNLYLVTNPVKVIRPSGTIVSASVSLGYDVPRGRVEELLVGAARAAGLEEPFVQILDLLDHAVVYRAAGMLREVKLVLSTRSRLRAEMLDALHGDGIEIVSPAFVRQLVAPLAEAPPVIPTVSEGVAGGAGAAAEDLAFDKAEEVENLATLRASYARGEEELAALATELEEAPDDAARGTLGERRARLVAGLEELQRRIEAEAEHLDEEHP